MRDWFFRTLARDSPNVKVFRAAVVIGLLTVVVKAGGTTKELVVARWFGRSDALDAFVIAFLLPSAMVGIVIGALQNALLPPFVATRAQDQEAAQRLFSSVLLLASVGLSGAAVLLGLLAPLYLPYLASGFSAAKLELTRELIYALLPLALFSGIASCASAVLNAGERFALPAITPLVTPLATIVFILLWGGKWGVFSLAAAAVAGPAFEAGLLLWSLRSQDLHLSLRWNGFEPPLRDVLRRFTPFLAASSLAGGVNFVDQSMTAMLAPGSVAALSYAGKVVGIFLALGGASLGTAVFPYFSKMVAERDWRGCRHTLKRYTMLVVVTTVPLTAGLMIFSTPLVRLLFQRGAFHAGDTEVVSRVLVFYAVQIPFFTLSALLVRFLSSVGRNYALLVVTVVNLALDVIFNLIFMRIWGVAGIALSTSLFFVVSLLLLSLECARFFAQQRREHNPLVEEKAAP
jgi:putative peptidoglycan lipid II flippase